MRHITLFLFFTVLLFNELNAQVVQDCGCSAALRYDIYRSKNDFYSEMLLAREINQENYRDIQQRAGADVSIFGIGIGANGENIQRIKEIYNERLYNRNVLSSLSEYESITTSNIAYTTYKECMNACIRRRQTGIDAFIVAENENEIFIDLHYAAAQGSPILPISYNDGTTNRTVRLQPNTWANPAIRIPRTNKNGFPVVFSAGGQYESVVVPVKPYRPLTANLEITYTSASDVAGSPISYSAMTRDNSRGEKGNTFELMVAGQIDEKTVQAIVSMNDGGVPFNEYIFSSEGFWATRVGFKATAKDGYLLRNPRVTCSGGCCGGWVEGAGFIRNDENMAIYTEKRYACPCRLDFTVETHKIVKKEVKMGAISTTNSISILLPPGSSDGVIRYVGGALKLGDSNNFLKLIVHTVSPDGYETYDYSILPSNNKTEKYKVQLQ